MTYSVVVPPRMNLSTVDVRIPIGNFPSRVASRYNVVVASPDGAVMMPVNLKEGLKIETLSKKKLKKKVFFKN